MYGADVASATAAAVGQLPPDQIRERWGGWVTGIVPPYHENWRTARPIAPYHKGDGHVTDDTLMMHLLVEVYVEVRRHLTAYDIADYLVPRMIGALRWIPELEDEALALHRVFLAEKYMALRLHWGHVDPREAGVGNAINCGAAMYMAPVGVGNAADPPRAYAEAVDVAGAHQSSYGREAAGVMAACVAAAMTPGATAESVVNTALALARDGTRDAIAVAVEAAGTFSHWTDAVASGALRAAVAAYDTVGEDYRDPGLGARRPSRLHSIEELPIALAMLVLGGGQWQESVLGAVNYGRDSDSIASMAGALAGAVGGSDTIPAQLADDVANASKVDLVTPGERLAEVTLAMRAADAEHEEHVTAAFDRLSGQE